MNAKYIKKLFVDLESKKDSNNIAIRVAGVNGYKFTFDILNGSSIVDIEVSENYDVMILTWPDNEYHIDCKDIIEIVVSEIKN